MNRRHRIPIKTASEIEKMRVAGSAASAVLQAAAAFATVGKTTREVDEFIRDEIAEQGGKSTFLGYRGFPGYACLSLNEEVVHGIGGDHVLQEGDLLKIDVGVTKNGYIGDNAVTVPIGKINGEQKLLLAATEEALYQSIQFAREGESLADLCGAVEDFVKKFGFSVVRDLVGHGVGKQLHEEPQVPNYRPAGRSPILKSGMVLAIEPMINAGTGRVKWLDDGWTVISEDRRPSSHFEHTVLVTKDGPEILTDRPRSALPAQLGIPPLSF